MTRLLPLLLLGTLVAGCGERPGGADGDAAATDSLDTSVPVEVLIAETGVFEDVIELTGSVESPNDATLSPDVPGTLIYVAPIGAAVRRGATVAQVDPSSAQAQVAQAQAGVSQAQAGVDQAQAGIEAARAQVAQAEAGVRAARAQRQAAQAQVDLAEDQYRRQAALVRDSILSALEFRSVQSGRASARAGASQADAGIAQAEGQLRAARGNLAAAQSSLQAAVSQRSAAQAGLRSARTQLRKTRVTAPFSGVVEERLQEPGELASPGAPVVRLVAGGAVKVTAGVPERYAGEIERGTQVTIRPTAYDAEARGGRVAFVGSAIDLASRTFPIEVALDNSDGALKPAMVVRLGVTRDVLADVISVPQDAVVRDERGTSVFVVSTDSVGAFVAARRVVELGPQSGPNVVIRSGLRDGEQVITSGQGGLSEGDRVRVTERRTALRPDIAEVTED